mmetsp:Transcript_44985/g.104091  ORF Transcript_44985/g.104091 Transcript_44985/m.104091 type:complete len:81 (-) Transcript_44985:20-262(-)
MRIWRVSHLLSYGGDPAVRVNTQALQFGTHISMSSRLENTEREKCRKDWWSPYQYNIVSSHELSERGTWRPHTRLRRYCL